jgi:hypothetical protein
VPQTRNSVVGFDAGVGLSLACPRAVAKAHDAFNALLRVRLVVEGGEHRRARARPLGDVAVVGLGPRSRRIEIRSGAGSSRRACGPLIGAEIGFRQKFLDAFAVVLEEERVIRLGVRPRGAHA